ncbi:MAG TPA: adenylate/guanylate cyclase domain-containing protein, partial [Acidimicrobiales bacterium]|nr:adenylate/guanylate cyclase domain-containing protein [Acidimicrobiales bacterium]
MGDIDLTPYSPRLLLQWDEQAPGARHRTIDGTLVFADVSGFTRLSERLARSKGKAGAEEMTETIGFLFGELLTVAAARGGEMLKYGGDAVLLFFRGEGHAPRAAAAAIEMQRRLGEIGRIETDRGPVRLRMSVGMSSGPIDLFKVGGSHEELVVAGPVTTETVRVEAAAEARQVLVSVATASALPSGCLGPPKNGGWLLRRAPASGVVPIVPAGLATDASRFLSVGLRDHLAGSEVHPDHRLATVAFIHALGMDALLAELDGPAVADRLHETVCTIQDACAEFDVSFLATDLAADGTKVMAAAGAPSAGDDDAGRMLLALTRMTSAGTPLPLRAGANRGHVFAAAVGPWYRKTYTTMGDVTNTAARLMAKAEPGEILVRAEVLDRSRVRFDAEELPPFAAKGKAEPLVPHRVVGPSAEPPPPTGTRLPLRGRDAELDELKALAGDARRGHGALVELVGDMGAGKSRLLDELLALVGDVRALSAHCEPYHRASPFHAVRVLLDQVLPRGVDRLEVLRGTVADRTPDLTPWVPLLAAVLDLDSPETDETRALEARFRLERTAVATVSLLRALLPDPAVLVVEDVHWLDDASAAVLRQLEEGAGAAPWLVVVTRRDEPAPFVPGRGESTSLRLTALADEHMKALVDLATGDAPLPPHERDILVTRAAGNPLY